MLWNFPTGGFLNPWVEFERMRDDMERLLGRADGGGHLNEFPAVNVWSDEGRAVLTAELPGINANDLDITVKENTVTIRGHRQDEELQEKETYLRQERGAGRFTRSFALPFNVDAEKVQARYDKGILQITLPKLEAEKPKQITVTAA